MRESSLCSSCAKDKNLSYFIDAKGHAGQCSLCLRQRSRVLSTNKLANLFKALIRFHYSERDYNPHWGGHYPSTLLRQENPLIKTENIGAAESADSNFSFDGFIDELTSPIRPSSVTADQEGVWIFKDALGEGDLYAESLQQQHDPRIKMLGQQLKYTNYHSLESEWKNLLAVQLERIKKTILVGEEYYRARLGVEEELIKQMPNLDWQQVVIPHAGDKIASPPQFRATAGRLNRQHIAYLYVATDSYTAMAEVRPHPGHYVSLGRFKASRELVVVDLANVVLWPFALNNESLAMFVLFRTIEQAFATPVIPGDETGYLATQFLADVIRQLGYDGVTYRSSVGKGTNITVFEPTAFTYVDGSASARKVRGVEYDQIAVVTESTRSPVSSYRPSN